MEEKEGDGHQVCEQEGIGVGRGECNRGHPNIEDLVLSRNSNYQYMYIKKKSRIAIYFNCLVDSVLHQFNSTGLNIDI
jgi:hypothetical protein